MANLQKRYNKKGEFTGVAIRVFMGRDPNGKQIVKQKTIKHTPGGSVRATMQQAKREAIAFEDACREEASAGEQITFRSFCQHIIEQKAAFGKKEKTISSYRYLSDRIYPAIGDLPLAEITPGILEDFYMSLLQPGANKLNGKGLAPKTIREHHRLISAVMDEAVKKDLIVKNPAKAANTPTVIKPEVEYYNIDDLRMILAALNNAPIKWRCIVYLLLCTGIRRGELVGIKWDHVNWDDNTILISRQVLTSKEKGIYVEDSTKTKSSYRRVELPQEAMDILAEYRKWQEEEFIPQQGQVYQDRGWVFTQKDGNVIDPNSVTRWMSKFSSANGLPHMHPHAFRHTYTSLLLNNGADLKSVSNSLGHSQVSITLNTYNHVLEGTRHRNTGTISSLVFPKDAQDTK